MPEGLYAARKTAANRKKHHRVPRVRYNARARGHPRLRGLVLAKHRQSQRQPSSGVIKGVRIRLFKNGKTILAHVPGDRADTFIAQYDQVIVEGIGGSLGRAKGTIPKFGFSVTMVNGMSLHQLRLGKKIRSNA